MSRRDYVFFIALVALVVSLALTIDATTEDARDARPSSFVSSPGGAAALQGVFDELGVGADRLLAPLLKPDTLSGPLLMLAPSEPPTPEELRALAGWIRGGGTLLYAARPGDASLDTLGLALRTIEPEGLTLRETMRWKGARALPRAQPETRGVQGAGPFRFAFDLDGAAAQPNDAVLLETADGEVVALRRSFGKGTLVAFSDVRPLVNASVGDGGAATVLARAAAIAGGRPVFDEYHHGFRSGGSPMAATISFLASTGLGHALLQIGVALLGLLLLHGARFGSPLTSRPVRRRDPLEHVDALAAAYSRARARRTAKRLLMTGMVRRIGARDAGSDPSDALATLRPRLPAGAVETAAALTEELEKDEAVDLVRIAGHVDRIISQTR